MAARKGGDDGEAQPQVARVALTIHDAVAVCYSVLQ